MKTAPNPPKVKCWELETKKGVPYRTCVDLKGQLRDGRIANPDNKIKIKRPNKKIKIIRDKRSNKELKNTKPKNKTLSNNKKMNPEGKQILKLTKEMKVLANSVKSLEQKKKDRMARVEAIKKRHKEKYGKVFKEPATKRKGAELQKAQKASVAKVSARKAKEGKKPLPMTADMASLAQSLKPKKKMTLKEKLAKARAEGRLGGASATPAPAQGSSGGRATAYRKSLNKKVKDMSATERREYDRLRKQDSNIKKGKMKSTSTGYGSRN